MDRLVELKGLLNKGPLQQVAISPPRPLINYLKRTSKTSVYGVHDHHELVSYLKAKKWTHDFLVVEGADGKCLHIIEALGLWLWMYQNGDKSIPKLILIGKEDFNLPKSANFSIYEQPRIHNTTIVTDTTSNDWLAIVNREFKVLKDDSILVLVVPAEKNIREYSQRISHNTYLWPNIPGTEGKEKGVYIVPGETDSKLWVDRVQTIVDIGLEAHHTLSPTGGEEEVYMNSDKSRIDSRFEWLGYDREGTHIRLFDPSVTPERNSLPAERRSIYSLISSFRALTPRFAEYLTLIPKERIESTVRLLDALNYPIDLGDLPYSPHVIKLIQMRLNSDLSVAPAILVGCLVQLSDNFILWPKSKVGEDESSYAKRRKDFEDVIAPILKRSSLDTYFQLFKDFYFSGKFTGNLGTTDGDEMSKEHVKWIVDRPYLNPGALKSFVGCLHSTLKSLGLEVDVNEKSLRMDDNLRANIRDIFKELTYLSGQTYVDRVGRGWIVDMSGRFKGDIPEKIHALGWKMPKSGLTTYPILYLWF